MKSLNLKLSKTSQITFIISLFFICGCSSRDSCFPLEIEESQAQNYSKEMGASMERNKEKIKDKKGEIEELEGSLLTRKLIKEALIRYHQDSLSLEILRIKKMTQRLSGYVSQENLNDLYDSREHFIQIKVPNQYFETFMKELTKGVEVFERKDINVKDVTHEYHDIEARIESEKRIEQRYLSLLTKAHSIGDIIELEEIISRKRILIESFESRIKVMERQVAFSTLSITIYKPIVHPPVATLLPTFFENLNQALGNGWTAVLWFVILIANVWPLYIVAFVLVFGIRVFTKRNKPPA